MPKIKVASYFSSLEFGQHAHTSSSVRIENRKEHTINLLITSLLISILKNARGNTKIKETPGEESEPSILIALLNIPAVIEPPGE